MKIEEFCVKYGSNARDIKNVMRNWQLDQLDALLRTLGDQHDQLIAGSVIVGDALHGGTLLDQIPPELKAAFRNLMHENADTYEKMRDILLRTIQDGDGTFRSFDDNHVQGLINKLKGQIGENLFKEHVGGGAELARSGCQEGWDVSLPHADGMREYIQVKLYDEPSGVIRHMLDVQQKVIDQQIPGVDHEAVQHVYFAVPESIKGEVARLAEKHDGLSDMIYEKSIPIDAHSAAGLVEEGMNNVGPEQLSHFFNELLCGAVAAGSLHAIVNGFLWYKRSKEFSAAFADATASTAISTTGIGLGLLAETLCHGVMLSSAVGIGSRVLLGRVAKSRWNFAEFLDNSIAGAEAQIAALQKVCVPMPATA